MLIDEHSMRSATQCLCQASKQAAPSSERGLYLDLPGQCISHPLYYYFRRIGPWERTEAGDLAAIARHLDDPAAWKPMLLWDSTYQAFVNERAASQGGRPPSLPIVALPDVVLLPAGPVRGLRARRSRPMDLVEARARGFESAVRHPWETARFEVIDRLIRRHLNLAERFDRDGHRLRRHLRRRVAGRAA